MAASADAPRDGLDGDPDAVIRELYSDYAKALHGYVEQFCPDRTSADDILQETFIRPMRKHPQEHGLPVETFDGLRVCPGARRGLANTTAYNAGLLNFLKT